MTKGETAEETKTTSYSVNTAVRLFLLVSSISMETWGGDGTSFIETWQVLIRKLLGFLGLKGRAPTMTLVIADA